MKKEYAVYIEAEAEINGIFDNDLMDWFDDLESAMTFALERAENLAEGESIYISEVDDGDFCDFPLEIKKENGVIRWDSNHTF